MKKLLFFVQKWPIKNNSSRDNLFYSLVQTFEDRDYETTVISHSPPQPSMLKNLQQYNHQPLKLSLPPSSVELSIFDSPESSRAFSYDVYNKYNKIPQILLLKSLNKITEQSKKLSSINGNLVNKGTKMWFQNLDHEQQQAIIRSDITIVNSQFLYYKLKQKFDNIIYGNQYLPLNIFTEQTRELEFRPFKRRSNFYFIGNLILQHNRDCVDRLISIWDLIQKQFPQQQLHIFSPHYKPELYMRKNQLLKKNIVLRQQLEDLQEISKFRMMLAPFQYHVDSPGQITDSWFYHTPVVTTPYGSQSTFLQLCDMSLTKSEGKYLNTKVELNDKQKYMQSEIRKYYDNNTIGDDNYDLNFGGLWKNYSNQQFADSVIKLSKDQALWNQCRQIGGKTLESNYSDQKYFRKILGAIAKSEYQRALLSDNSNKRQAWFKYNDQFSKIRRSQIKSKNKRGRS